MEAVSFEQALGFLGETVGALVVADQKTNEYRSVVRRGLFADYLDEEGKYEDLVQKLWFHFGDTGEEITDQYKVFIPNLSTFVGRYSKRVRILFQDVVHIVQMTIHPVKDTGRYLFVLDELDESESVDEAATQKKVSTIQNIYLFSMYFDLGRNTTSSLSLTEVSNETMNSHISYTDWRMMIVNMMWDTDQDEFLRRSDPAYLRENFTPGKTESFDVQMKNLAGEYIWVKLIFSRVETSNADDYRFVYMVQNIHETTVDTMAALKRYEELASRDPMTSVFNHGRIETEICNAIEQCRKDGSQVAMMMLDLDHFKQVNDQYGHAIGDATLVHFTEILREVFEGCKAAVGRWGGEEFVALCYDTDREGIETLAEQIRSEVEQTDFTGVGRITCSIGVTMLRREDAFDSAFERMDGALYDAKEHGRNRVSFA